MRRSDYFEAAATAAIGFMALAFLFGLAGLLS